MKPSFDPGELKAGAVGLSVALVANCVFAVIAYRAKAEEGLGLMARDESAFVAALLVGTLAVMAVVGLVTYLLDRPRVVMHGYLVGYLISAVPIGVGLMAATLSHVR